MPSFADRDTRPNITHEHTLYANSHDLLSGLVIVVVSALLYAASSEGGIHVHTWMWAIAYLAVLSFEMVRHLP